MEQTQQLTLETLNKLNKNTLMETLSIEFVEIGEDYLVAKMPVTHTVHQPYGLLHGGASVALAETVGSTLSALHIDLNNQNILGLQISANHLKSITEGEVFAKATFIKKGRSTHLVEIKIKNQLDESICHCMLTNYIKTIK